MAEDKKTRIVAMISANGGTGKTTLSICLAHYLVKLKKRILFVDCDLESGDATKFFNPTQFLVEDTVHSILIQKPEQAVKKDNIYRIDENLFLLPSGDNKFEEEDQIDYKNLCTYIEKVSDQFEIIILDCPVKNVDFLQNILTVSNTNIFITAPNLVQGYAISRLYLRIGEYLKDSMNYQIINKTNESEQKLYSQVDSSVLFEHLETVRSNEAISTCISTGRFSEIGKNAEFTNELIRVCRTVFPEMGITENERVLTEENELKENLKWNALIKKEKREKKRTIIAQGISVISYIVALVLSIIIFIQFKEEEFLQNRYFSPELKGLMICIGVAIVLGIYFLYKTYKKPVNSELERDKQRQKWRKNKAEQDN